MTRWFRIYDEILDDPKVQLLSPELFRAWINILAIASKHGGKLPAVRDMAFSLRLSVDDIQSKIDDLILAGLIDVLPGKKLEPHNWSKRQWKSDDSLDRVRKHRAKKSQQPETQDETVNETPCNAAVTVTATPPDTETDTDTDSKTEIITPAQSEQAAERPAGSNEFLECKRAFNGATDVLLAEVMRAMGGGEADRGPAETWLRNTMLIHGGEAMKEAFAVLETKRAKGEVITSVLPWWSKTASTLKAKPTAPKPQAKSSGRFTATQIRARFKEMGHDA